MGVPKPNQYKNTFIRTRLRFSVFFLLLPFLFSCGNAVRKKDIQTPEESYAALFKAVQTSSLFPDSKTFVDAIPKTDIKQIEELYLAEKDNPTFNLKTFVYKHFSIPEISENTFRSDTSRDIKEHINSLWPVLSRLPKEDGGSLIPLRKPYIVPGGRFREVYYWDSYFTMLGLAAIGKDTLIENMVINFAQLIQDFDHIPNGNRSYYLSRSQPPFFAAMVQLLAETRKDNQVYQTFLPQLQKEYQYWMASVDKEEALEQQEALKKGEKAFKKVVFIEKDQILNRYFDALDSPRSEAYKEDIATAKEAGEDPKVVYRHLRSGAESGWDFSSRWFTNPKHLATIHTTDFIPVDLNALLFNLEAVLEKAYRAKGDDFYADNYKSLMQKRKAMLDKYCWDAKSGFYYDYDFVKKERSTVASLAAVYPLAFGLASTEQAEAVAKMLKSKFLQAGGLTTTLNNNGQQWDAPNGWAPLQWLAISGLKKYGYSELADDIKNRWIANNLRVYKNTGKLVEKYNVYDLSLPAGGGEYPVQDGFGWTNGVLLDLMKER